VFAGGMERIYHFHLRKCGGTTLNAWLDWHVADDRIWQEPSSGDLWWLGSDVNAEQIKELCEWPSRIADETAFFTSAVIHSHIPMAEFAPPETYKFTVLRNPVDRLLSQVADWRREARSGVKHNAPELILEAISDSVRIELKDYLLKYSKQLPILFDNHQTRMLAIAFGSTETKNRQMDFTFKRALAAVNNGFEFVGITERMGDTVNFLSSALGLAPDASLGGKRNVTNRASVTEFEIAGAKDIIADLTHYDSLLYADALDLFEQRVKESANYEVSQFEKRHAATAVKRQTPQSRDRSVFISSHDPIVGAGFFGRDRTTTGEACLSTGPTNCSVLYMQCPQDKLINVELWIRAYAVDGQRAQLRFEIDDQPVSHQFVSTPHSCEKISIGPILTARSFVKLTILFVAPAAPRQSEKRTGVRGRMLRALGIRRTNRREKKVVGGGADAMAIDGYGWSISDQTRQP